VIGNGEIGKTEKTKTMTNKSKKTKPVKPVYVGWVYVKNGEVKNVFAPVFAKKFKKAS
jgi:hypothetical protein